MMRKAMLAAVLTAMLSGCGAAGGGGETYQLRTQEVRSKLLSIQPPTFVFGDGKGVTMSRSEFGQNQVVWTVSGDGKKMIQFTATFTPEGDNATKVALSVDPVDGQPVDQITHSIATTSAAMRLYGSAMVEQIDAKLENRSFNMVAIQGQLQAATGTTFKQVDASLDNAVKEFDERDRARKERQADAEFARDLQGDRDGDSGGNY